MNTTVATRGAVTHDDIARRAEALWAERGRPSGQDDEIWYEAERQVRALVEARADETVTVVEVTPRRSVELTPAKTARRRPPKAGR